MKTIKTPHDKLQGRLFEDENLTWWARFLSPNALRRLEAGWQGIFRRCILKLMPAKELGKGFSEDMGRPSKELYSMAGLMLIAEFKNWTGEQAAEAYTLDAGVQFALNLPRDRQYLSARSVDNYRKMFRENELAQAVFVHVGQTLVEELELDIKTQRLDSTHVHSHMAQLSRQQLLAVGIKRFVDQLRKHQVDLYADLDEEFRKRYERAETRLFGFGTSKALSKSEAIAQAGQDMSQLIERFDSHEAVNQMQSYQAMKRLFGEHFEVEQTEDESEGEGPKSGGDGPKAESRDPKSEGETPEPESAGPQLRRSSKDAEGGSTKTLQNPSDEDAGYNGKKGPGYQAQIAQCLPPRDEDGNQEGPGLITGLIPQSAAVRDNEALAAVLDQQEQSGLNPQELTADTLYGSDQNVQDCAQRGIDLISPVGGVPPTKKDPKHNSSRKERERKARLAERREDQESDEWKQRYAKRSGIEGLNRALDVVTGFKKLRVRGLKAVGMALYLKGAGWNIWAAAKIMARRKRKAAMAECHSPSFCVIGLKSVAQAMWKARSIYVTFFTRPPSRTTLLSTSPV